MLENKLRNFRLLHKKTVQQMADFVGVPKRTYEDWESGRRHPDKFKEECITKILDTKEVIAKI